MKEEKSSKEAATTAAALSWELDTASAELNGVQEHLLPQAGGGWWGILARKQPTLHKGGGGSQSPSPCHELQKFHRSSGLE